ncbi:ATP-binding protein [Archangium sp.]|uniref:ATP-binding protein n=1 Tax=Archangium sp. TaxID=1872627 RepID=UPI003899BA7D
MTDTAKPEEAWREQQFGHEAFEAMHLLLDHFRYEVRSAIHVLRLIVGAMKHRLEERSGPRPFEEQEAHTLIDQAQESCAGIYLVLDELPATLLGQGGWEAVPEDVHELLDKVLRLTQADRERTCRLEKDYEPELPRVQGPRGWLVRVFFALVIDALATLRGKNHARHELGIRTRRHEGGVRVTISATGPGLPPRAMDPLFEPRCPPLYAGSGQWLGLGRLQALLEQRGGALRVESAKDHGVTFDVRIPTDSPERDSATPVPLDELGLRLLQNDERDTVRALVACTALEILERLGPLRSQLKRLSGHLDEEEKSRKHMKRCFQVVRRVRDLCRDLRHLRYVQPEPPLPVYVEGCLSEALRITRGELAGTARVEEDLTPGLPPVPGSAGHLLRVFLLLLRGSLRAMKLGPSRRHVLRVRTWREDSWVRVALSDTSSGIPPDTLSSVLDSGCVRFAEGNLMEYGLPISHAILQGMGGELRIDNQEGHGTTYSLRLPVAERP